MDAFDQALLDHFENKEEQPLWLHTSYGAPEEMPVWYFFRSYEEMPEMEQMALSVCEGRVLDVGAGTGVHSLILEHFGHSVTAIDTSAAAVEIMKKSGLKKAEQKGFYELENEKFDTILLLMNGLGLIGKLNNLPDFLEKAATLLNPGGQLIFDTSDIRYLYDGQALPQEHYYGEVSFCYEYKGQKGEWFDWVYIDKDTLSARADKLGWYTYFLHSDENDQYLVRLIRK